MFHILLSRYKVHRCQLFLCLIFDVLLAASPSDREEAPDSISAAKQS